MRRDLEGGLGFACEHVARLDYDSQNPRQERAVKAALKLSREERFGA